MNDFSTTNMSVADRFPGIDLNKFSHVDLTELSQRRGHEGGLRFVPFETEANRLGDLRTGLLVYPQERSSDVDIFHDDPTDALRDQISIIDGFC